METEMADTFDLINELTETVVELEEKRRQSPAHFAGGNKRGHYVGKSNVKTGKMADRLENLLRRLRDIEVR